MRTVILKREKNFSGSAMLYQVKCDGKLVATLKNGQEKTIELDGERHGIQCFADTVSLTRTFRPRGFTANWRISPPGRKMSS